MSVIPIEQIFKYVNQARTNPQSMAKYVEDDINSFVDNRRMPLMPNFYYSTNEGISAWKQCHSFLLNTPPLYPYKMSESLNLVAKDHALDMKKTGIQGHRGSDGSTLTDRIQRRCGDFDGGAWAQNIGSAFNLQGRNHALKTVLGLIIDDGVKSRGHRENIFSQEYQYIGIYSILQGDKFKTVMNFHSDDLELADSDSQDNDNNQVPHKKQDPYNINIPKRNIVQPPFNQNQNNSDFFSGHFDSEPGQRWNFSNWDSSQDFNLSWGKSPNTPYIYGQQRQTQIQSQKKKPKKNKKVKIGSSVKQNTEYINGKTVVRTVQTIHYSDGSIEEHQTVQEQ